MTDQNGRDDGTQKGPGEQIRPVDDKRGNPQPLGENEGPRPTEDDLAKRDGRGPANLEGGDK